MSIANIILKFATKRSARRFEKATRNPVETQKQKMLAILQKNKNTEYGKRYIFSSIKTVADYQKQVPIIKYKDIHKDVKRIINGQKNILTAEDPIMFAQTSGTTGDPKYISVTPTCQGREHSDVSRTWLYHTIVAHPSFLKGKIAALVSPAIEGYTPSGIPFGSASGHIYKNMPKVVQDAYAAPYEVFEISDYTAKYYALMRIAIGENVGIICTANPSSILKMCEKGNEFSEEIIKDIHNGTLSRSFDIEPEIRTVLEKKFKADPSKARVLEQLRAKRKGRLLPGDYWPDLAVIGCWKGGTVGHYLEKFPGWFDPDGAKPVPIRDWGYLSSEARGSIPLSDEGSAGVLTVATNFYEFVEVNDLLANPDDYRKWIFLTTEQIENEKEYYIFVTTTGGLYRYDINDIIKVQGYYNKTPQIIFLRKGRGMTNITGEKLSVNQVIDAFEDVNKETHIEVSHFKAEADTAKSRYLFRVEFFQEIGDDDARKFLVGLDEDLKKINIEYKSKRDSLRLNTPIMHVMSEGWYERQRREMVESGKRAFQAKTQLLTPEKMQTIKIKQELSRVIEV